MESRNLSIGSNITRMKLCKDCGTCFDDTSDMVAIGGAIIECPYCRSMDWVETQQCGECGQWITGEYISIGGYPVCEDCYETHNILDE